MPGIWSDLVIWLRRRIQENGHDSIRGPDSGFVPLIAAVFQTDPCEVVIGL